MYIIVSLCYYFNKVGLSHWHLFANELKNLHAHGLSSFSRGLKEALDLLNVQRLHSGIDQYGQVSTTEHYEKSLEYSILFYFLLVKLKVI